MCRFYVEKGQTTKVVLVAPNMDFMRLRNESRLIIILREIFTERSSPNPRGSDVFGLSDPRRVCKNAQSCIRTSSPALGC